jgi:hypothetical protein
MIVHKCTSMQACKLVLLIHAAQQGRVRSNSCTSPGCGPLRSRSVDKDKASRVYPNSNWVGLEVRGLAGVMLLLAATGRGIYSRSRPPTLGFGHFDFISNYAVRRSRGHDRAVRVPRCSEGPKDRVRKKCDRVKLIPPLPLPAVTSRQGMRVLPSPAVTSCVARPQLPLPSPTVTGGACCALPGPGGWRLPPPHVGGWVA